MKLNKIFDENPPYLKELSEGIQFVPIIKIKELLWQDFAKWEDVNFQYTITLRGHDVIVSGSLELVLYYQSPSGMDMYRFTGSATFVAESNQNWLPILNSECIKNAVKKLGRKYAMYTNQEISELEEMDNAPKPKKDKPKSDNKKIEKGIKDIINQTQTK
jgi:hypothetical protein